MSGFVDWIGAQKDDGNAGEKPSGAIPIAKFPAEYFSGSASWRDLSAHSFPAQPGVERWEDAIERNPDLWMYRDRTVKLLRRYMRFSLETGRLPSLVGAGIFSREDVVLSGSDV
jgi:hypothetical protein